MSSARGRCWGCRWVRAAPVRCARRRGCRAGRAGSRRQRRPGAVCRWPWPSGCAHLGRCRWPPPARSESPGRAGWQGAPPRNALRARRRRPGRSPRRKGAGRPRPRRRSPAPSTRTVHRSARRNATGARLRGTRPASGRSASRLVRHAPAALRRRRAARPRHRRGESRAARRRRPGRSGGGACADCSSRAARGSHLSLLKKWGRGGPRTHAASRRTRTATRR